MRVKGELDLIGYDGDTLAIVEVRTRRALKGQPALPEISITKEKQRSPRTHGTLLPARPP
ncbi:MAG TPA: YraN family protein [Candidatus Acidoferrales bacterium]|nr:YraN family protein [Candidatus Acidoferrales bacterium]